MDSRAADPGDIAPILFDPAPTEYLLVWATRKCAFRCGTASLVDLEFRRACGDRLGPMVSAAFRAFLRLLAGRGRRPLALGPPGWGGVTHDEQRLLQIFAAAQAEAGEERMRMHLAWFLPAAAAREARPCVVLVARTLRDHGHRLSPERSRSGPIARPNHAS